MPEVVESDLTETCLFEDAPRPEMIRGKAGEDVRLVAWSGYLPKCDVSINDRMKISPQPGMAH
jgi:hypothetical protein